MKDKVKITEDNYREVVLKRAIISYWIILAICLVITICGGHFFYMYCDNKTFIAISNFIDNSFIRYIIFFSYFSFEQIIMYGIVNGDVKIKCKERIYHILIIFAFWIYKILIELGVIKISTILDFVLSAVVVIAMLIVFTRKTKHSIYVFIYDFILLMVFAFIKNTSLNQSLASSFMLDTIFMLDYYSSLMLTYLYSKKRKLKKEV